MHVLAQTYGNSSGSSTAGALFVWYLIIFVVYVIAL